MQRFILPIILSLFVCIASAQYKNDNVLYKTIFPQDLCKALEKNTGYLLLDVRSAGEYSDTSSSAGLNIGHLGGAINIDIRQMGNRLSEIAAFKEKPVFVYCSHSQRSRRVSKMLADSGFTNINNINGGMTALYLLDEMQRTCLQNMITTNNKYAVISAKDLCIKLSSKSNSIYLLDVRTDSAWNHIATNPKFNAYGYIKGSQHIALNDLRTKLSELPRNREIIITDLFGADAAIAAKLLKENGFEKVSSLIEGMDRWLISDKTNWKCSKDLYVPAVKYTIMSSGEYSRFQLSTKNFLLLDIRTVEEFSGKHAETFRNIGHLKNAVNIPAAELKGRIAEIEKHRSNPVVLYAFSGNPEVYNAANTLLQNGFKDVRVLAAGLFNIRWTASNVPGMNFMHDWVEEVPPENK